ncbi:MAG: hypothetical protein JWQ02_139 [Capsulimonas sp.]|nr:hypothetical protein [Capsulimonas sp.]
MRSRGRQRSLCVGIPVVESVYARRYSYFWSDAVTNSLFANVLLPLQSGADARLRDGDVTYGLVSAVEPACRDVFDHGEVASKLSGRVHSHHSAMDAGHGARKCAACSCCFCFLAD